MLDRILIRLGVAGRVAPAGFRYHDLRHYFASLLIADGADIRTLQTRVRHGSATTMLRTYTDAAWHRWP